MAHDAVAEASPIRVPRIQTRPRHVLVVDDDQSIRAVVSDILTSVGYTAVAASDGLEALSRLSRQRPDLIVLDLMMPSMSGWEFLERARHQLERLNIPVMVLSAIEGRSDYPSMLGVAAWFTKPFEMSRFISAVQRLAGAPGRLTLASRDDWRHPARVLIVEDEPIIAGLLRDQLEDEGYLAEVVDSLADARRRIAARPPALILLDLMLPVEDGWSFLSSRRQDLRLSQIPVLAISAAPHERMREAKRLGADAFVSKPFDIDALTALVRSFAG